MQIPPAFIKSGRALEFLCPFFVPHDLRAMHRRPATGMSPTQLRSAGLPMAFEFEQKVLFKHCDPAGIVFYPRYFEMMNDCMEAFFEHGLKMPFETFVSDGGVPTAQIETRFVAPSRHGDILILRLIPTRIGRSSLGYEMRAFCGDELRFDTTSTLVHVNNQLGAAPWPEDVRARLLGFKEDA